MKITDIQVIPLNIPLKETPPLSVSGKSSTYHVLVKVFTDEGITGYGEAFRFAPGAIHALVDEWLKPLLIGRNPMHVERLWDVMYNTTFRYGRKGITLHAISGIEVGLWDIIGKYRKMPIYEMIGGLCRHKIRAYASLHRYDRPDEVAAIAARCVEQGYTAIKLHQHDIESVKLARHAVGNDTVLMLDATGSWTPREAVQRAKELEQYDVLWIEEPIWPMDDYDGLAYVKSRSNILVASGENEYTHYGFRELITKQAVDIIQPDVIKAGGILQCRKIFALAEAWNLQIATHSFYFGPGLAATTHLSLSNLRSEYVEINPLPLQAYFIHPPLRPENGYITIPDRPGLGIEVDEEVVRRHSYTG